MVKVFFRNDDVFENDQKFVELNGVFIEHKIPVHHSITPKKLTGAESKKFIALRMQHPDIIEYGQHGYAHRNYGDWENKSEFMGRAYSQQRGDIGKGKEILAGFLGEHFTLLFTPPYHTYDGNTLRVMEDLGFAAFSSGRETSFDMRRFRFSFVPVCMSFHKPLPGIGHCASGLQALIRSFVKIKDQALFWVYTIEWIAVSATLMVCGSALWTLMVRRRAYREVRTTRLR